VLPSNQYTLVNSDDFKGAFHLMACPVRPELFSVYQWKDLVYVSQISSENGPHSDVI
jgi:hypothetical protein